MSKIEAATKGFPLIHWLSRYTRVSDNHGDNIEVDCPHCRGRRNLKIHRTKKLAQCFKCLAGHSQWKGTTNLIGLIEMFAHVSRKEAYAILFTESKFEYTEDETINLVTADLSFPKEAVPLTGVPENHPAMQLMLRRHMRHLIPHTSACVTGEYAYRLILELQFFGEVFGFEAKTFSNHSRKSLFPDWLRTGEKLYATRNWDTSQDYAVITESVFDAETLGINALGIFGSTLRDGQLSQLISMRQTVGLRRLIWFLDEDAWLSEGKAILHRTSILFDNFCVPVPHGQDPNSLGSDAAWQCVMQARLIEPESFLFEKLSKLS